ncbi:MAG: TIGR01777 family oxidoreductase [Pseudonocardia sp.]|uniref:TIGR01777 family oxidoreductase n=1 Tax=unclassified Pseudonocardia TaxID=2619320 RepID=UPI000B209D88|nr:MULTISPECIES: TIGR01777 family oxidoreductase [unclassified Pseudonocardia]MBN9110504.1 TIGR01777 family oxidoreductase [Pseudonocardia sp.]
MRVVVAGSSGLIGTSLVAALRAAGHDVVRLVRRAPAAPDERGWDPPAGRIDDGTFDGVDAVVNLGGVGIGDRPWSGSRKQAIRDSRNVPTDVLARAVAEHGVPTMVSGSAVGYYGDTGPRVVSESAPSGQGFLADVCRDWEAATQPAVDAGARVVLLRTGLVLSPAGGLLGPMKAVWKLYLGARLGSGRQYMSWVSLDDEVGAILFAVENPALTGPVNVTGPTPVTNRELTRALGVALGRPAPFAVPAFAIKAVLGEMGEEMLLFGQRAVPTALLDAGYQHRHNSVTEALAAAV